MKRFLRIICFGVIVSLLLCLNFLVTPVSAAYTSYSEMGQAMTERSFDPNLLPEPKPVIPVEKAIIATIPDRATFDSLYPGAPLEDFESTLLPDNTVLGFPPPLNSSTNNAAYAPGGINNGISIDVVPNGGSGELVVLTPGFLGAPSAMVGANSFNEDVEIIFSGNDVLAVAMDIYFLFGVANTTITVYGPASTVQGTIVFQADPDGEFFAIATDEPITRITLVGPGGELIDNVSFSGGADIPTLNEWGAIIMILSLLGIGAMYLRNRQTVDLV